MSQNARQPISILIVDDDEIDVRTLIRGLHKQHIPNPVFVASDGIEGLQMLRGTGGKEKLPQPCLILLDLNMPRANGIEFLREIRGDEELRDSTIFVFTTSDSEQDKAAAYREHVAGYLLKSEAGEHYTKAVKLLEDIIRCA